MLIFVDESGDSGLKGKDGSSNTFVVTLIIFNCHNMANDADQAISDLRFQMEKHARFEFKFNRLKINDRKQFLQLAYKYDFTFFSIVINKAKITSKGLSIKESFYKYACSLVFANARHLMEQAIVVIDGCGSREFRRQLQRYLKNKVNDKSEPIPCIKKVKIEDSKKNNLLQLVDVVCGAVAQSFKNDDSYRKIIRNREGYVQFWPK